MKLGNVWPLLVASVVVLGIASVPVSGHSLFGGLPSDSLVRTGGADDAADIPDDAAEPTGTPDGRAPGATSTVTPDDDIPDDAGPNATPDDDDIDDVDDIDDADDADDVDEPPQVIPGVQPTDVPAQVVGDCNRGPGTSGDFRLRVEDDGRAELDRGAVLSFAGGMLTIDAPSGPLTVIVDALTEVDGSLDMAEEVRVRGTMQADGSILADEVRVLCPH